MEFLILTLFLISALVMQYKPRKRNLATGCAVVGCAILIALEFYVNLWVVVPIGNF